MITILLCGVLTCRQHFQDQQIVDLATQIYQRINWPWMLNGGSTFSMVWTPESGFLTARWDTYSELMMLYLFAIGATATSIPASAWQAFARPSLTYQGLTSITNLSAPLFIHQYSHAWFDFRNKQDAYANYFNNSLTATQAHKLFCSSLAGQFSDYSNKLWGITASDSANGYVAWGGRRRRWGQLMVWSFPARPAGRFRFCPPTVLRCCATSRAGSPRRGRGTASWIVQPAYRLV